MAPLTVLIVIRGCLFKIVTLCLLLLYIIVFKNFPSSWREPKMEISLITISREIEKQSVVGTIKQNMSQRFRFKQCRVMFEACISNANCCGAEFFHVKTFINGQRQNLLISQVQQHSIVFYNYWNKYWNFLYFF